MAGSSMIVVGEKESFIVRVLIQKAEAAGCSTSFVHWSVNDINNGIGDAALVTLYLDEKDLPDEEAIHFLIDKMNEKSLQMVLIGEQRDIETMEKIIPAQLIYQAFSRPVNNADYVTAVTDYFQKMATGELRKCILVVDDDPQYLTLVREWLKEEYKVAMANSGMQAIKWLGKNKADLILLDHEMPVTTGPQVLEMLRSDDETKAIPVMFLTGKSDKESVMSVVALRPEGYFLKNIGRAELLEKLKEFFIMHK
ncbi:two-component system response regulator [Butyrivibrio sp. JL13D10]|uniref:response regulator n=1 Tax=Butyrivibrio sp. JL13D10 TaxID=3236815 RepID=UPI0038B51D54